jgi:hypothetical protein
MLKIVQTVFLHSHLYNGISHMVYLGTRINFRSHYPLSIHCLNFDKSYTRYYRDHQSNQHPVIAIPENAREAWNALEDHESLREAYESHILDIQFDPVMGETTCVVDNGGPKGEFQLVMEIERQLQKTLNLVSLDVE